MTGCGFVVDKIRIIEVVWIQKTTTFFPLLLFDSIFFRYQLSEASDPQNKNGCWSFQISYWPVHVDRESLVGSPE